MTASFIMGIGLGLAIAVPVGPMGLLCIQRTLVMGARAGVATGCGAATVHLGYSALAAFGFGAVASVWLEGRAAVLSIVSALVLFWLAAKTFRRKVVAGAPASPGPPALSRSYISAVALGMANPSTIVLFAAALPAMVHLDDAAAAPWLVGGAFAGSLAWWVTLVAIVAQFRAQVGTRALDVSTKASAVGLAGLAAMTLVSALGLSL